jgi:hypothetical protein
MPVSGHPGEYVPVEEEEEGGGMARSGGLSAASTRKATQAKAKLVRVSPEEAKMRASAIAAIVRRMTVALAQDEGEISQLSDRVSTLDR